MNPEDNRRRLQRAALQEHAALVEQSAVALRHSLSKCAQNEGHRKGCGAISFSVFFRFPVRGSSFWASDLLDQTASSFHLVILTATRYSIMMLT